MQISAPEILSRNYALEAAPEYDTRLWNGSASNEELEKFYKAYQPQIDILINVASKQLNQSPEDMFPREGHRKLEKSLYTLDYLNRYQKDHGSGARSISVLSQSFDISYELTSKLLEDSRRLLKDQGLRLYANCATYSVDGNNPRDIRNPVRNFREKDFYAPDKYQLYVSETIKGSIREGLTFTGDKLSNRPGFYNVALFIRQAKPHASNNSQTNEFHFIRQNPDGTWSHKYGQYNVTNIDFAGQPITDPLKADFDNYKFIGYAEVPKGGLNRDKKFVRTLISYSM